MIIIVSSNYANFTDVYFYNDLLFVIRDIDIPWEKQGYFKLKVIKKFCLRISAFFFFFKVYKKMFFSFVTEVGQCLKRAVLELFYFQVATMPKGAVTNVKTQMHNSWHLHLILSKMEMYCIVFMYLSYLLIWAQFKPLFALHIIIYYFKQMWLRFLLI